MIRIGITGQTGFIGTHLFNTLELYPDKISCIPFEDNYFESTEKLEEFVRQCDTIVHLAAMNRHNDAKLIYKTNIRLVKQLISACEATSASPDIFFSSSTQEDRDNPYGKSKLEGRQLFEQWAKKNNARFCGFIIPNVFGPFGDPYYNSVIATFCHQLSNNETPKIQTDAKIKLIYISELVQHFLHHILMLNEQPASKHVIETITVQPTFEIQVSSLLEILKTHKANYFNNGAIPSLDSPFKTNLFNTFISYIDHASFYPFELKLNNDERGSFVETIKLSTGGQISFSITKPGITRGNHFHTRKAERFAIIKGKARIEMRRIGTDKVLIFYLDGNTPSFIDMPVWYAHNITNIGNEDLYTIFWINEFYNPKDPDTFFEPV